MITMTRPRSRPAESPASRINAEAAALAAQAEIALLRKLLFRCDIYMAAVVQEALIDGQPDAYAEGLRRDIALALSG
jgi:hypothetical protein